MDKTKYFLRLLPLALLLAACVGEQPQVTEQANAAIVVPTDTSEPTATLLPTNTPTVVPTKTNTPLPTVTHTPLPTATNTATPTATFTPTATPINPQALALEAQRRLREANSFFYSSELISLGPDGSVPIIFKEQCRFQKPDQLYCFQASFDNIDEQTGGFLLRAVEILAADGSIWTNSTSKGFAPPSASVLGGLGSDPAAFELFFGEIEASFVLAGDTPTWIPAVPEFLNITDPFPPFTIHEVHGAEDAVLGPTTILLHFTSSNSIPVYEISFHVDRELMRQFNLRPFYDLPFLDSDTLPETAVVTLFIGQDTLLPYRISYLLEHEGNQMRWLFRYGSFDEEFEFPESPN